MAKFDESKVINALHVDKAEIGKKYWFNDSIYELKEHVEHNYVDCVGTLGGVLEGEDPFEKRDGIRWGLLYPHEEPPEQRMTHRQLAEWLAKGNGERRNKASTGTCTTTNYYTNAEEYDAVPSDYEIRPWGSDEWVTPTVDIYERDCKNKE